MKQQVSPAVVGVIIAIVVVLIVVFGWKSLGPRTDGPSEPIDMGKMMGGGKTAAYSNKK